MKMRRFEEQDYPRLVEIRNAIFPDYLSNEREWRHEDDTWEGERYFRERMVAEDDGGRVVAFGQIQHMPHQFDPQRYAIDISVDPAEQRRGIGSALFDRLMGELRRRDATIVRSEAKESLPGSLAFLARRGFVEVQRFWESRLDLASFDPAPFAGAEARAAANGITFTTLADEYARDGEAAIRAVYELDRDVSRDIPLATPMTDQSYEQYSRSTLESPNRLFDACSIAKHGERIAGLSGLFRSLELPGVLYQGLTGVRREYRRQGIALALKMRGTRYALEHGYGEIRTWNNARNRPMLSINEAMGFVKQPAWIELEKTPI